MKKSNAINACFLFPRRKILWFAAGTIVFFSIIMLVRGLVPNRLQGGQARFIGAYGPATVSTGFALKAVGIQPGKHQPHSEYSKVIGKRFVDEATGESYSVLAIKHEESNQDFLVVFNVSRKRNILTGEDSKRYGGDTVLAPVALISWDDLQRLNSGELKIANIEPTGFPKGCEFGTSLRTWMSLTYKHFTYPKCRSETSVMSINGKITSSFGSLGVDMTIRVQKDEFWFGEKDQIYRRYSEIGVGIRAPENRR